MRNLVLLGGGYGNMKILEKLLSQSLPEDIHITLVDRNPYHCLKTEYYALAAGTISDQHIRVPFPKHPQITLHYGEVTGIHLEEKQISFANDSFIAFDDLVIGLGCIDKYHHVPGALKHTYSIQTIEATREAFSVVNNLPAHASVAIVGAGLSGVELASELWESRNDLTIDLYDRGKRILPMFPEKLSQYVTKWFDQHGITIVGSSNITKVEERTLYNHDVPKQYDLMVWTAGIQAHPLVQQLPVEHDQMGRAKVNKWHQLEDFSNIYVVGDCAALNHAPSAQLAEGQGEQIAQLLQLQWKGDLLPETLPHIKLKGVLGSLGKKHGFGLLANQTLLGRVPRLLKSGILWMYKYHKG